MTESKATKAKREWRERNKERERLYNQELRARNVERDRERKRRWREENRERERQYQQEWYQQNRDRVLADQRKAYRDNRAAVLARHAAYYQANKDAMLAQQSGYQKANLEQRRELANQSYWKNPERYRELAKLRDSKRRALLSGDLTPEEWQAILEEFDHCCAYCQARDVPLAIEHVTPLSRGGRHTKDSVVPACKSCNSSKGAKTLFEFAAVVPIKMRPVRV